MANPMTATPPELPSTDDGPSVVAPTETRERLRSRRKREVRGRTISVKRMTKREIELGRALYPVDELADVVRPKTRAECADGVRPCPFISCAHHLYLDVSARTGAIKLNFPDIEPDELTESCALDVADRGGVTLEEVGAIMNLTRERIRQLEVKALAKAKSREEMFALRDFIEGGPNGKRKLPVLQADDEDDEETDAGEHERPDDESGFDVERFASDELATE